MWSTCVAGLHGPKILRRLSIPTAHTTCGILRSSPGAHASASSTTLCSQSSRAGEEREKEFVPACRREEPPQAISGRRASSGRWSRRFLASFAGEGAGGPAVAGTTGAGARAGVPRGELAAGAHLLQPRRALAVPRGRPPHRLRLSSPLPPGSRAPGSCCV